MIEWQHAESHMNHTHLFKSSILSGVFVGIAGFGYLAGKDNGLGLDSTREIFGSILFAFALLGVVNYKLLLYTGSAGFITRHEKARILQILLGNIVGCGLIALLSRCSAMPLQESAQALLASRLSVGIWRGGLLAIGCGFIMTTAVTFARKGNNLPLLIGVPLFILCGFPHCIADAFYYLAAPLKYWQQNWMDILIFYLAIVLGNFAGCNFYRWVMGGNPE